MQRAERQDIFLGKTPVNGALVWLNGAIRTLCVILNFVASSAAEAELGALFLNAKAGKNNKTDSRGIRSPTATYVNAL